MILIASREEKELIQRLRSFDGVVSGDNSVPALAAEVILLKKQIASLEIDKSKKEEDFARQERELRHMVGLERKRQEVEMAQAKRDTELTVREGNLQAEKERFAEQLRFNTERFEKMETYLKDMMGDILQRLPNVTMKISEKR